MNINFSTATQGKLHAPHIIPRWELIPCLWLKRWAYFLQTPQRSFPSAVGMWEGPCVFCLKWNGPWEALTQKKARFPCSGLNSGYSFISQHEGMSESPVENLEKAVGVCLIWTGGLTSFWPLERNTEFNASTGYDAWLFLKMGRNPNITVPNRKWTSVSSLTTRSVCIVLPTLV